MEIHCAKFCEAKKFDFIKFQISKIKDLITGSYPMCSYGVIVKYSIIMAC